MLYRIFRQIHLVSAVVLASFILMYFATGYVLVRSAWFGRIEPLVTKRVVPFQPADQAVGDSEEDLTRRLQDVAGIRGQPLPPRQRRDGSYEFRFFRPGYEASMVQKESGAQLELTERHHGLHRTFVGLHRLHAYRGGWLYWVWAAVMDLSSLAMIVFAISGVWLWFKLEKVRWPGWILLAAGFAYTLTTVVYLLN